MNDELVERQAAYNLHFLPLPGRANDRETQMARLQDYMIADRDEDAAKRVRDYYGEGVPVGAVSEKSMQYFVGAAMARNLGISGAPEAYWLGREKPEALPEVEQQDDLYTEMGRDLITKTQDAWVEQQVKLQERRQTLGTVLQQIVQEGEANKKESAAWLGFLDAQGRGVWSDDEQVSLVKATEAFSMMRGLMDDPQSAGANVLTKGSTGQLIFDALYGDEMATGLFFSALQDRIADMKTAEEERNALVQFAHAFESATKNLTAGMMGGHFRAFVTDEQVEEFNANRSRHEAFQTVLQGAAGADYEAAGGLSVMEDMRLQEIAHAARESGQLNADGSLRKMTDEERRSTQELNEFRGQLHNAVQGVYDIDGLAKLGKMMPGSLAYLVPGGMLASAMSMRTHDLASQLGEGSDWVSANARATVNAAIQAGVEKMAFGSIKATKMAPGLDALMSTGPMARVFGKLYGTTAGRIGMGVVAGGLEETFAEPAAGLLLSGIYNAFAPTGLELDSPWVAYKNEMAEMLEPDQILATALYGLLLGGVNVPGHRAVAKHYKKVVEGLERIGIDHNVAANMARSDGSLQQIAAGVQQVDAALKKDAGGVFGYIAELYPQLQEISTFENLMRAYNLPKMLPGEGGNVRVQYKDEDGKVQELVMSQEAGRLFVQARIEQLGSKVQVGFADMVLGLVMTGKVAEKSDSWVVSVEDADMNADYFRRIAAAAGIRLSQGAKATDIDPEIHPYIPLGTLAQQGRAWESRMRVARGEVEEKLGRKLTDEEWTQREQQLVSRVNRVRVASQDGRVRTVLRVARGGYGAMEVLEDVTEDFLSLDMEENGRELGWYADNLLELERVLGRQGAFLHALKEGESYDRMAIIEGVGKLVQSKVLADTTKKYKLSEKLNAFLDMIRHLVQRAVAMLKLGKAINKVLADKEASAKLDPEFVGMVDRLVEKDVEFLRELQLEDGLAAMQRVLEKRVPRTPVLAEAEAKHGEQVLEEAAAKAAAQRKVDEDVAEGEAAVDGDMSASVDAYGFASDMRGLISEGAVTLHNAQHGDILYEAGNPDSFGAYHVIERRMQQGFSEDEAARIAVLVGWAAMKGTPNRHFKNRKELDRNNVRAVVAIDPNGDEVITGFAILNNKYRKKDKGAGASAGAHSSQTSYASDGLNSVQQKVAALERSIEWFEDIVKKNPNDFELVIETYVESLQIKHKAQLDGTFMKAPNGEPTRLTEQQWLQVRTEAFKAWFGDWENAPENASKVVDENGEPLVVTHATNAGPFTVFRKGERAGLSGKGIYFSPDGVGIWGKNIMRCFLNVRNPLTKENAPREVNNGGMSAVIPDVFERYPQFDGVMLRRDEITVRDPEQIKSATDNRGTFDGSEADITLSVVGESAANWEEIKHLAFRGRDDGKLRVELDSSQAKLKKAPLHRMDVSLVREVDRRLTFFRDELEKKKRWETVSKLWSAGEYDLRTYDEMDFLRRVLRGAGIEFRNLPQMAELGVCAMVLDGDGAKRLLKVVDMPGVEGFNQLGEVLDFPELFEAYPELKKLPVRWMDDTFRYKGSYLTGGRFSEPFIMARRNRNEGGKLSTLLHEAQHWIQHHEDFAFGSVPGGAKDYKVSAGEIEARNVQARRWLSAEERAALPFNETLTHPGTAEAYSVAELAGSMSVVSFSLSPTLMEDIARARKRAMNADGTISQDGEMPRGAEVPLCTMPDFMRFLGEADVPIVARVFTLRKLLTDHKLTDELTYEVVQKMNDPVLAIQETPSTYLVLLDVQAENKDGVMAPVVCAVEHKKGKDGNRYLVSAYSLDNDKERKITQQFKKLVYCKYNTTAKFTADAPQGRAYDLLRAAISGGHTRNVATYEDVVKGKENSSYSIVDLNGEEISNLVEVAGRGMKANEAFVEKMMAEIRGSLLRMRKLGSKTRTDREDALVAMGGISQMVKALVLSLPQGYRFAVQPYMNKLDVLTELAMTGNVEMLRENVSKGLQAWMDETSENWHEVLPQLSGNENMTREELTARVQEMMKEHAGQQLTEAVERIVERVAGQLRKHAKDTAVKRIHELLERVMPKRDPKSGKLKGGKMSADAYRDLQMVAEALGMKADKLEEKLAGLRAKLESAELSEAERDAIEGELMVYDQFGDLESMSAKEAVAALEALRQRIWMERFEWENIMAERRAARRAVVRKVVDGVGSISENEYNAKKRRMKPTKRLKHLGDILSGMPAALAGLRGYLPLRELAAGLEARANRAGELIKQWEAERWEALETLSKETMGRSWRLCMDYMHEVLPTGVSFDRPKYRTVDIKVAALRELLQMDAKERKAEMKRRRESGGKEAETALSERDIEAAARELERMDEAGEVKSWVHAKYLAEVQHEENLRLSRGEALYAILMYEQPTYTERMEAQGYTPEVIAGFREFVGEGLLRFGYGLRELFALQGDRIAVIYEREFGVPFPREENYFAARWVVNGMKENPAEQLLAGMAGTPGAGNGWMKQRVDHNLELDMTKDALQVFLQATTLTDTWMATQDIVADFKAWTRDKDFERALTTLLGKEGYDNIKDWVRILELGGVQDCLNMGVTQDVINGLYGSGAVAILGLRVQTLIRQLASVFNGLLGAPDISAAEWMLTLARMKRGEAPMTYKKMKNSVLLKSRQQGRAGNMASQAVRSNDSESSATEELLLASMLPMEWVDASCTAMSLVPVWNIYYQRAVEKGASHAEAERAAWEQTTIVANLASQPIGVLNRSKVTQNRSSIVKAAFFMLSESTAKFAMCRALWKGHNKKAAVRAWLVYGAANAAISALLDALQGDPEKFEEGKWWEYVVSALYGPLASIPGMGELVEELGTLVFFTLPGHVFDIEELKKAKTSASVGRALIDVQGFVRAWGKIFGFLTDDEEHSLAEYTRAASTISRTTAIATGWMGNMVGFWSTAVAVLMNPIDFGARVYRNMKQYYEEE